jgi:hypothetical protein
MWRLLVIVAAAADEVSGMMGCLVIDHHIIIVSHPVYQSIMVDSCLIYRFAREASLGCVGVWMCDTSFVA